MPRRAPSPCSNPGCGKLASQHGRCGDHPHPHRWGPRRPQARERYGVSPGQYKRLQAQVWRRDQGTCYLCHGPAAEIDHVMPIAEGGAPASTQNLAAICRDCHASKSRREVARSNKRRARQQ